MPATHFTNPVHQRQEELHAQVCESHQGLAQPQAHGAWAQYQEAAVSLPARLRENGLASTLRLLHHQSSDNKAGVWRLLQDWLGAPAAGTSLSLRHYLAQDQHNEKVNIQATGVADLILRVDRNSPHYLLASRLAMAEAQRLKRSAEAVRELAAQPQSAESTPAPTTDLPTNALAPPSSDLRQPWNMQAQEGAEHFGLYWRYGGMPQGFNNQGASRSSYHSAHITHVLAMAQAANWFSTVHASHYKGAYARWSKWLKSLTGTNTLEATVATRLHIGLGAETVHDTQVLLHPVTGMPYLPGSTLKGALRAWLERGIKHLKLEPSNAPAVNELQECLRALLGHDGTNGPRQAGAASFFDAWWVPGDPKKGPLVREVETPHHSKYYTGGQAQPTAWDNPIPIAQIAVQGSFLLAINVRDKEVGSAWATQLLNYLAQALQDPIHGGLGGKARSAGYGRFTSTAPTSAASQ
jgi:CRISPR-associated protein Cmr6